MGDPDAVFVFQAGSTLVTASASTVTIVNGVPASACNIFWKVGSSATLGSGSSFVGTVLAQESISLDSSAVIEGRLLTQTGAVTMINNTITNTGCPVVPDSTPTTTTAPSATAPATTAAPTTAATQATTPTPTDGGTSAGGGTTAGSTGGPTGPPTTDTALAFTGSNGHLAALGLAMVATGIVLAATSRPRRRRA